MSLWQSLSDASRDTLWRSLQTLNATRIVIAIVLLVYLSFDNTGLRATGQYIYADTCILYLLLALMFAMTTLYWRHRFMAQVMVQITIDIAIISVLYLAAGGARTGLAILYLFPLAGAAILAPLLLALFLASLVTLFLLAESTYQVFMQDAGVPLMQAGLYGGAFFAAVLVVSRLAAKLIGQEDLAIKRGIDLDIQMAINRIVIADVGDGVLVVGRDGRVFAGNPAARRMLGRSGDDEQFLLSDVAALEPVRLAFLEWVADPGEALSRPAYVVVKPYTEALPDDALVAWQGGRDQAAHLKLRFARVDTRTQTAERSVIFLQDVTAIENEAQQLKLASMGRLTASIAHEVRNPLSAIGHATSLLAEEATGPVQARLLSIIGDNVARVNRMVEDILKLSRKVQPHGEPLVLGPFLQDVLTEFTQTQSLADDIVWIGDAGPGPVRFDALHLREVVLNLLSNAQRYASGIKGSIRVYAATNAGGRMELHVQDDGPGITPEVRAHLFEPFYTTSSKGTGLGLYLARELCLNNEAMLDYEYRFDGHAGAVKATGRFVITFAQRPQA